MKEMLKNKTIIAFIVIMLGITIISTPSTKLEETKDIIQNEGKKEDVKPVEISNEQQIQNNDVYKNKEEIDKIMNKKDSSEDDDFFDEFFE